MVTHSGILAWRTPWTEEAGGLQSMGSQRVRQDWVTNRPSWLMMLWQFPVDSKRPQSHLYMCPFSPKPPPVQAAIELWTEFLGCAVGCSWSSMSNIPLCTLLLLLSARLSATPWTASRQASLPLTLSWSLPKYMLIPQIPNYPHSYSFPLWQPSVCSASLWVSFCLVNKFIYIISF